MQDNRRQLKKDTKGVIDLPIKLLVIMVILCIAIPIIVDAANNSQRSMMGNDMNKESERIIDTVTVVYYSGNGSSRTLDVNLPQGCELSIGGDGNEAYTIKSFYNGDLVSTRYFEKPTIAFDEKIILNGNCNLMISCSENNEIGIVII